jgi:NADPH2:quinone reductase
MVKAIRFAAFGGPEVLRLEEVSLPPPGAGEVRVRHSVIGLNFVDIYQRSGLYPVKLPSGLGGEAAGIVEAAGADAQGFTPGMRVAYGTGPLCAYAEAANVPARVLVKIPDGISDETAAAMMLKGMTAEYLLRRTYAVKRGDTIVFHAASGGVGLIACQWAAHLGATVIGVVGSRDKEKLARAHGCAHVVVSSEDDIAQRVREITGGKGVPVVYDSVGKATFMASLDCLKPRGLLVSFGNASGPVTGVDLGILTAKGSLYVTRPSLRDYAAERAELEASAQALFDVVQQGAVKIEIRQRYALKDVAKAHTDLAARRTTGASILIP